MNTKKLESLIDGKKFTKAKVIKATGISRPALDSILAGNDFKVSNLEKLARALNIKIGFLFDEEISIEEYHAHGDRGFVAKKIGHVDQRESGKIIRDDADCDELRAQIDGLQKELLEAKDEIIKLMKEKI